MKDMPTQSHRKRRKLRKTGILDEDRFYDLLSAKCNHMDVENVKMFYGGLLRLIKEELREREFIRLPHLGDLEIIELKPRVNLGGKRFGRYFHTFSAGAKTMRFYPVWNWRKYFTALHNLM